ncbi:MAG: hypothetical protein ACK4ME_01130 [Fimbriimonadales bacterium]
MRWVFRIPRKQVRAEEQQLVERWAVCAREVWVPKVPYRPITFRLPLIGYQPAAAVGSQLLESGLQWLWCCWEKEYLPWQYPLKLLTQETLSEFVEDSERQDIDEFLYFFDAYGWVPEAQVENSHRFLAEELMRFWGGEPTSLQVVLQRLDDEPEECTYVSLPQSLEQQDVRVPQLLQAWGVDERFSGFRVFRGESEVLKDTIHLYQGWIKRIV